MACHQIGLFLDQQGFFFFSSHPSGPSLVMAVLRILLYALLTEDKHGLLCIHRACIYTFVSSFTFTSTHDSLDLTLADSLTVVYIDCELLGASSLFLLFFAFSSPDLAVYLLK